MVKLDERTRFSLRFDNLWAIVFTIVSFAMFIAGYTYSIKADIADLARNQEIANKNQEIANNLLTKMEKNFEGMHKDVVQNHDDLIVLKQIAGIK